jgi:hypothetical protein
MGRAWSRWRRRDQRIAPIRGFFGIRFFAEGVLGKTPRDQRFRILLTHSSGNLRLRHFLKLEIKLRILLDRSYEVPIVISNLAAVMTTMGHKDVRPARQYQHPDLEIVRAALNRTIGSSV